MKKILLTLTAVTVSALTMYGQGRVLFNNVAGAADATVAVSIRTGVGQQAAGEGAAGAFVGANYSIQLLWAPQGTYASQALFLAAVTASGGSSGAFPFIGTTGGGPAVDGAGLFDAGQAPPAGNNSMPAGTYTMQARAWYNNGIAATYDLAAGHNTGVSGFFDLLATAFPTGPNNTVFPGFTVGVIPEPSTFALAGFGVAALLLFRRRK